jgi:TonB family protein
VKEIHHGPAGATTIETSSAPDGQDDDYARFVRDAYTSHWDLTGAAAGNEGALTKVSVTIGSSGKVISSRILRPSGNAEVDGTVQRTLDSVAFIRPFGEEVKELQRTYTINFNCNAQRP